jgi:hypothetical protein
MYIPQRWGTFNLAEELNMRKKTPKTCPACGRSGPSFKVYPSGVCKHCYRSGYRVKNGVLTVESQLPTRAFMAKHDQLHEQLKELTQLNVESFHQLRETANWAHVGTMKHVADLLVEAIDAMTQMGGAK